MNPELQRNLWLQFSQLRLLMMPAVIGLCFFAALVVGANAAGSDVRWTMLASVASTLHFIVVIVWGSWAAARSVVGEIRERTWDGQRLSSIGAWAMVWGKLFGATAYVWYGGAMIIAGLAVAQLATGGPGAALEAVLFSVLIGVFAHASAMLASLVAIRRRYAQRRIDVVFFQITGLAAAALGTWAWTVGTSGKSIFMAVGHLSVVRWFAFEIPAPLFCLGSLGLFVGWTLIGCWRLMRTELQHRNSPVVFLAFLLYMMLYVSGLAATLGQLNEGPLKNFVSMGSIYAALAAYVASAFTYVMVFLDPKDWVLYRWLRAEGAAGRFHAVLGNLQGWMVSLVAFAALSLYLTLTSEPIAFQGRSLGDPRLFFAAGFLFALRDVLIVLFYNARPGASRADLGALIAILVLYLVPAIVLGPLHMMGALGLFLPSPETGSFMSILSAAAQAALVYVLLLSRLKGLAPRAATA